MFDIAKNGGYVISIVPREIILAAKNERKMFGGGYGIPEIDYTPEIMENEMRRCGVKNILILLHNIMGYRIINDEKAF